MIKKKKHSVQNRKVINNSAAVLDANFALTLKTNIIFLMAYYL